MRDSLNEVDSQEFNCLYYAVYHGHLDVVKMLKMVGVEYKKDGKGTSCLHIAIMRGHFQIVEFFLRKTPKFDELAFSTKSGPQETAWSPRPPHRKNHYCRGTTPWWL